MKAAVHTRYGPPEVVRVQEVAKPSAGDGEVLVKVHATTVNRTDCGYRRAHPFFARAFTGLRRPRRTILGTEFAGQVEAVGAGVTAFKRGDRVFGFSGTTFGAHAEYLTVRADSLMATVPDGLGYEQVAPATEGSHYALSGIRRARIGAGHDVLVYGATGAIGSAAVQILKSLGANVTAVCPTEHLDVVTGLGADRVIDHTVEDFTRDAQRYDVVIDAVGKSSFGRCRRLLKPRGSYLSTDLGPLSMNPLLALVSPVLPGRNVLFPLPMSSQEIASYLRGLLESGAFKPLVDRTYPLEEIVEAYRYVETGRKLGNVVIRVAP